MKATIPLLRWLLIACLAVVFASTSRSVEEESYRKASLADQKWWVDARFGLFIHWGPVSLKGTEISWSRGNEVPTAEYDALYERFNPTKFDAKAWVAAAKAAGAKYLVFTTRHHDGFTQFDSRLTGYKITRSPFGRDVVAELAKACHEAGLRLGFYYSPPDWHHPDFRTARHARFVEYMHGQIRELCTRYGRLDILWFDGLDGTALEWESDRLFRTIRRLQPRILLNNRAGLEGDFDTPEQTIGAFQNSRPWESCITLCGQWSWKPDDTMKSLTECLHTLIRCAGGDGNLLLNVGPMPSGEIEPRQAARLEEIGGWLRHYGKSIYATRGGPFLPGGWGASTYRGNIVYIHVLKWDGDTLDLPAIPRKVVAGSLLTGGSVKVRQTPEGISIRVPRAGRQAIDTIVALTLDGPAADIPSIQQRSGSLAAYKPAAASNVFQQMTAHAPGNAFDDDDRTRWATDFGTRAAWLQVDLGKPRAVGSAVLKEEYAPRIEAFELQYKDGEVWRTFARGSRIGAECRLRFEPVTARVFRLNIVKAGEGPTLSEFWLLPPKP